MKKSTARKGAGAAAPKNNDNVTINVTMTQSQFNWLTKAANCFDAEDERKATVGELILAMALGELSSCEDCDDKETDSNNYDYIRSCLDSFIMQGFLPSRRPFFFPGYTTYDVGVSIGDYIKEFCAK